MGLIYLDYLIIERDGTLYLSKPIVNAISKHSVGLCDPKDKGTTILRNGQCPFTSTHDVTSSAK